MRPAHVGRNRLQSDRFAPIEEAVLATNPIEYFIQRNTFGDIAPYIADPNINDPEAGDAGEPEDGLTALSVCNRNNRLALYVRQILDRFRRKTTARYVHNQQMSGTSRQTF